jgi:hypothetical protein
MSYQQAQAWLRKHPRKVAAGEATESILEALCSSQIGIAPRYPRTRPLLTIGQRTYI